ncbi:methylated-DNA--[protein]-cysteine S-methyltransferase [Anaerolentibacter hominis]|uniref:methylated-DNA--[protein]-cysteine S-methyltransferase n=1 Tax=Anaerolentibacter hominis TaxID=3079009 RepID=UPI003CCE9113
MVKRCTLESPAGLILIEETDGEVTRIGFTEEQIKTPDQSPVLHETVRELLEYFEGNRKEFELPLHPSGTAFQKKVWDALKEIPYGETRSYKEIAQAIGNPKACRAVGMANHNNPIGIVIPCHRVLGANGALTGYAGGLDKKASLLFLEQMHCDKLGEER